MRDDIYQALKTLREGGVILYPTDTVWGLGCDATDPKAVAKIYELKKRADSKSMLVLASGPAMLERYAEIPEIAWDLIELTDKPLTIIYPGAKNLANNLIADDGSIGIRVVKDEFCIKLMDQFRKPIVSTSANISGNPAPAIFDEIDEEIIAACDYVVEWRRADNARSKPSGIIKLGPNGEIKVIRE